MMSAMDDAIGAAPRIAAHRDDIAPVAHRDGRTRSAVDLAEHRFELLDQPLARGVHFAAGPQQRGARTIEQLAVIVHREIQPPLDGGRGNRRAKHGGTGGAALDAMELRRGEPRRGKSLPNRGELPALQHTALEPEPAQRGGEWWNRRHVDPVTLLEEAQQLRDRGELSRDPHRVVHRAPGPDPVGAKRTSGKAGHQLQSAPELQDGQRGGRSLRGQWERGAGAPMRRHPVGFCYRIRGRHPG